MLKSKRGISPILATLLLIVIAVAAIVVTYAWVITFTGSTTGQAGVLLDKDNVSWGGSNSTKYIVIYVRNKGISDAEIDKVYIGLSSTNLELQSSSSVSYSPSKFVYANGGTITINVTKSWATDTTYYFKIAPKTGTALEFSWGSPHS